MVINNSITLNNVIHEDIFINNSSIVTLKGITNGEITISDGSSCCLQGIHNGDITVNNNCSLQLRGTLNGNLDTHGDTNIYGIVKKSKITGTNIFIHKDAIVNGKRYLSDTSL